MNCNRVARDQMYLSFGGAPPRSERFCRLLPLLSRRGVKAIIVDWEESFPWAVDERMRGPGAFREEEVAGIHSIAADAGLELIPRLARFGLPLALDRVAGFAHLSVFASTGEPADVASVALRMVDRLLDDMVGIVERMPRLELGAAGLASGSGHPWLGFCHEVQAQVHGRGIAVQLEPQPPPQAESRSPEPIECTIAAALGLDADADGQLAREVLPVSDAVKRLDQFVDRTWITLRSANQALVRACRDQGERHAFAADHDAFTRLGCISAQAEALHAELMPVLSGAMESAVAATLLAARLSPVAELAESIRQRIRALY